VDQTNRDVASFLLGIKYDDFSVTFTGKHKGKSFGELYESFNEINKKFRDIQAEKEAQFQYLQTIVESVNVGLLCIDKEGEVLLMNKALKDLLQKPYLVNADAIGKIDEEFYEQLRKMETGDSELLKVNIDNRLLQLSVKANEFKLRGKYYKLLSMQNIQSELEEQELIAWKKLIRILTHEIMNSVTPIVSLTSAINDLMKVESPDPETLNDVRDAIRAIQKRSEGLLHFTETYRSLTKVPPPRFQTVNANTLLNNIHTLFTAELKEHNILLEKSLPQNEIYFQADPELLEQVLINLIKNAIDAVKEQEQPKISLTLMRTKENRTIIQVVDNGGGIEPEILDQIFIPFYTTKREGSGIGLSLSRQIIGMHKGTIGVQTALGEGTVFTITF